MATDSRSTDVKNDAGHTTAARSAVSSGAIVRLVLAVMFGAYLSIGLIDGGGGVLWPEVKDAFRVTNGVFGVANGLGLVMALPVMLLAGRIADRFDKRSLLLAGFGGMVCSALVLGFGAGAILLIVAMMLRGLSVSLFDLGNNAIAIDYEQLTGKHVLGPLHAMYSGGTVAGALLVWGIFAIGGGHTAVYVSFSLLFLLLAGMAWRARTIPMPQTARTESVRLSATVRLLSDPDIRLLGIILGLCMFGEIVIAQWAGIYLRDVRGAEESVRVIAIASYGAMMFAGRLFNGPIVHALGTRRTLVAEGALTAAGGLLVAAGGPAVLAIAGCGLAGLGLAGMIPLAVSIAGGLYPGDGPTASGAVLLIGYGGLVGGPFIAGLVATLTGPRGVMLLALVAGAGVAIAALRLRSTSLIHQAPAGAAAH